MKKQKVKVSLIPNLDTVQCMPIAFAAFYDSELKKVGGVVFAEKGRPHVLIDESATGEEMQDMINWVQGSKSEPKNDKAS